MALAVLVVPGQHSLRLQDLLQLGDLLCQQGEVEGGAALHVSLTVSPANLLTAPDVGEGAGDLSVRTDQVAGSVLVVEQVEEVTTLRTGGTLSDARLLAGSEVTGGEVRLTVRQGRHLATVRTLDTELQDLSVSDGVREDVGEGDVGVVVGTRLALTQPGDQTGATEPVATDCLLGVSLAQQTYRTLKLCWLVNKGVLVASLVVVLGVDSLLCRHFAVIVMSSLMSNTLPGQPQSLSTSTCLHTSNYIVTTRTTFYIN